MNLNFDSRFDNRNSDEGGIWHVEISGEIDIYNSDDLKNSFFQLLEEKIADIHVNCEKLTYIDSTGLGALVGVLKKLKTDGKKIHLIKLKPNILKLLSITKLDEVFLVNES